MSVGPELAESVSIGNRAGTSVVAATETFMKSRGMSELPPASRLSESPPLPGPGDDLQLHQNATSLAQSGPLQDVPGSGMPHPRSAPCHRTRHLYRSLDGRLETTKAQRDVLHHFSNINAPVSALETREAIDLRTASAVNQNG